MGGVCLFPANTVQPLQPRGLNNAANGANVGFIHIWPPHPANDADALFNPIQSPGLGRLGRDLDQLLMEPSVSSENDLARRIDLARLSMEPPDKKTELPPIYIELKKDTRDILEALKDLKKKMKQNGDIRDSSDSDIDSDTDSTS